MEIHGVEIKKVVWAAEKVNGEGETTKPPTVTISMEVSDPATNDVKELIDFAKHGTTVWSVESVRRSM